MVLMSRFLRLTSRWVAKSGFGGLEKHLALGDGAAGQPNAQRVAQADVIGIGLRDGSAHPGVAEIDDGHDRLSRVQLPLLRAPRAPRRCRSRARRSWCIPAELRFLCICCSALSRSARVDCTVLLAACAWWVLAMAAFRSACAALTWSFSDCTSSLLRFQIAFRLHPFLVGGDALLRQFNRAPAVALGAYQRGFRLRQLGARSTAACACALATLLDVDPVVACSRGLHLRDLVLEAVDGGGRGALLRLQFRGIEHRDQVALFHRCALVHQQLRRCVPDSAG